MALQATARDFARLAADALEARSGTARDIPRSAAASIGQMYWLDAPNDQGIVRWQVFVPTAAVTDTAQTEALNYSPMKYNVLCNKSVFEEDSPRAVSVGISLQTLSDLLIIPRCVHADSRAEPSAKDLMALVSDVNHRVAQLGAGEWSEAHVFLTQYLDGQRGARKSIRPWY
jgi:hypothetical protein